MRSFFTWIHETLKFFVFFFVFFSKEFEELYSFQCWQAGCAFTLSCIETAHSGKHTVRSLIPVGTLIQQTLL